MTHKSRRQKNIKSHIESGDYFGTLATILDLLRQDWEGLSQGNEKVLLGLTSDLTYLQAYYIIRPKKADFYEINE